MDGLTGRYAARVNRTARRVVEQLAARRHLPAILDGLSETSPPGGRYRVQRVLSTGAGSVVAELDPLAAGAPPLLLKLSRLASQRRSLRREARFLRLVHGRCTLSELKPLVPRPMAAGDHAGWRYLVQSRLAGRRPSNSSAASEDTVQGALAAIAVLHRGTSRQTAVDERLLRRWVDRRIATVQELLGPRLSSAERERLLSLQSELRATLARAPVGISWIHGDYWPANVLVSADGEVVGLVDWDSLQLSELALHDTLHYVVSAGRLAAGEQWGRTLSRMLVTGATLAGEERALADLPSSINRRSSLLLYWLRGVQLNRRRHPASTEHLKWLEHNVRPVLEVLQ